MKTIHLKGQFETKKVWLNGNLLSPLKSQLIVNHSPDGFGWAYGGSGPAQLALAICLEVYGLTHKERKFTGIPYNYQDFKWKYIATLPQTDFDTELEIEDFNELEIAK